MKHCIHVYELVGPGLCPHCGKEAAKIVQSDTPDQCGARVWIEAESILENAKTK